MAINQLFLTYINGLIMNDLIKQAADLRAQAAALEAQAEQQKSAARQGVLAQVKAVIAEHGFSATDLGLKAGKAGRPLKAGRSHPSAGKKVTVKFKDAQGNTWTGRGVKPRWLSSALQNGATLQSFAI
jgi:DNA-binding protein H-NS